MSVAACRVLLLGNSHVGKSSIVEQFVTGRFDRDHVRPTVGMDYQCRTLHKTSNRGVHAAVTLQLCDTAGQERFRSVMRSYYRNIHAVVLVYDVTHPVSFCNLPNWVQDMREYSTAQTLDELVCVLVGNKVDRDNERMVRANEGQEFAAKLHWPYFECSASDPASVGAIFDYIASQHLGRDHAVSRAAVRLTAPTQTADNGNGVFNCC